MSILKLLNSRVNWELFRRRVSDLLERFPHLYCKVMRLRKPETLRIACRESIVAIEGFPRCANSFAVQAFNKNNNSDRKKHIATHLHTPANVIPCIRWGIPTLILIRKPDACVISFMALRAQLHSFFDLSEFDQLRLMKYWTKRYTRFYDQIEPYKGRFVLGEFKTTTSSIDTLLEQLNAKFGGQFEMFGHSDEAEKEIFEAGKVHLSPSKERDELKERIKALYWSEANFKPRLEAERTYTRMLTYLD